MRSSAGVMASPVLSSDGSTIYVNGRDERLWALHAADGKPKWSVPLKFLAQTPPSVTPSGLIVSGGGPDTRLVAFKDAGDHAQQVWRRNDVSPLSTSSLAGPGRRLRRGDRRTRRGSAGDVAAGLRSGQLGAPWATTRYLRRPGIRSVSRSATTAGW